MQLDKLFDRGLPKGDFALVRVMGEPGSEVFQARARDGRDVVLRFWRSENELDMRSAIEIASNACGVRHPMLASVFGVREHADGTLSLVSEYVPGRTLDAWVAEAGLPPLTMAVDFVRRLALGMHAAHQHGLSHHAFYPGNIVVVEPDTKPSGRIVAKLLDLGVPRAMRPGVRFEAAHFMAPEALVSELQSAGRPLAVSASMNVYSCGCLLHYLCTGQPPFQSDSLEGLSALQAAGAVATPSRINSDIPENLERVIAQALEREPKRRVSSAAALAASLSYVESVWRNSGVRRKAATPPPPPPAANVDRVPRVPPFDLVLMAVPELAPAEPVTVVAAAKQLGSAGTQAAASVSDVQAPPTSKRASVSRRATPSKHPTILMKAVRVGLGLDGSAQPEPTSAPNPAPNALQLMAAGPNQPARAVSAVAPSAKLELEALQLMAAVPGPLAGAAASAAPYEVAAAEASTAEALKETASSPIVNQVIARLPAPHAGRPRGAGWPFATLVGVGGRPASEDPARASVSGGASTIRARETSSSGVSAAVALNETSASESRGADDSATFECERGATSRRDGSPRIPLMFGAASATGAAARRENDAAGSGRAITASLPKVSGLGAAPSCFGALPASRPEGRDGETPAPSATHLQPTAAGQVGLEASSTGARLFRDTLPFGGVSSFGDASKTSVTAVPEAVGAIAQPARQITQRLPSLRARLAAAAVERERESAARVAAALVSATLAPTRAAPSSASNVESEREVATSNETTVALPVSRVASGVVRGAEETGTATSVEQVPSPPALEASHEQAVALGAEAASAAAPVAHVPSLPSVEASSLASAPEALDVNPVLGSIGVSAPDCTGGDASTTSSTDELLPSAPVVDALGAKPVELLGAPEIAGGDEVEILEVPVAERDLDVAVAATSGTGEGADRPAEGGFGFESQGADEFTSVTERRLPVDGAPRTIIVDVHMAASSADDALRRDVEVAASETHPDRLRRVDTATTPEADAASGTGIDSAAVIASEPEVRSSANTTARERPSSPDVRYTWFGAPALTPQTATAEPDAVDAVDARSENAAATVAVSTEAVIATGAASTETVITQVASTKAASPSLPPARGLGRVRRRLDADDVAMLLLGVTERNSLAPYEVLQRNSSVRPREDIIQPALAPRERSNRRWPWVAAVGAGVGAYVSLLALVGAPSPRHAASRPHDERPTDTVRAEGPAFPITSEWQPALATAPESAASEPSNVSPPSGVEHGVARADASQPAPTNAPGIANTDRSKLRRSDRLLDGMRISRDKPAAPLRSVDEPLIVSIPSPLPAREPAQVAANSVADSWATPSVVNASELRPSTRAPRALAEPPAAAVAVVDLPTPTGARTENLEVRGSLSDAKVRRAIDRIRAQLTGCFAQYAPASASVSVARVELTIDETGRVRDARVHGASSALEACLVQASRKLVSGPPDTGTVRVVWNLRYGR